MKLTKLIIVSIIVYYNSANDICIITNNELDVNMLRAKISFSKFLIINQSSFVIKLEMMLYSCNNHKHEHKIILSAKLCPFGILTFLGIIKILTTL